MPPPLIMSGKRSNVFLPDGSRATHITSDLYGIAERLKQLDPELRVDLIEHVNGEAVWAINHDDGNVIEHFFNVGPGNQIDALDARVIEHVQWCMRYTPAERVKMLCAEIDRNNVAAVEASREKLYEKMAPAIYRGLHEGAFLDTPRSESFNKRNKTAIRAGRGQA